jgi:hypothetical protein
MIIYRAGLADDLIPSNENAIQKPNFFSLPVLHRFSESRACRSWQHPERRSALESYPFDALTH